MDLAWQAALLAGAFVALGATLVEYLPAEWKGQIQKPVHHERIWAALSSAERAIVADTFQDPEIQILAARRKGALSRWARSSNAHYPANSRLPDVLDAVGLGLFHLGRITKDGNRK